MSVPSKRITAIDDVRVLLMLPGVMLHAALQVNTQIPTSTDFNFWMWMDSAIHVFRMQAFFMLSGYLSWKVIHKSDHLIKRARQLLLPAVATLLVLFPLATGNWQWLHPLWGIEFYSTWFMFTLYLLVLVNWILWKTGLLDRLTKLARHHVNIAVAIAFILQVGVTYVHGRMAEHHHWAQHFGVLQVIALVGDYELFYLAGLMLAKTPNWQDALRSPMWRWVALGVWVFWLGITAFVPDAASNLVLATFTSAIVSLGIVSLATQTRLDLEWTRPLCPASVTIYLWHLPVIMIANKFWVTQAVDYSAGYEFIWLCAVALNVSLFAHYAITRWSILRWIWLGEQSPFHLSYIKLKGEWVHN